MKFVLIATAAALALPLPAVAQSLNDTHELVWHPAGKTPSMTYRLRDRAACVATPGHHQSGKTAMPAARKCPAAAIAKTPAAPKGGEAVAAQ